MKKTLFFVSDIHGEYTVLRDGLEEAGYDEDNPNHLLVVLGDIFDRGDESKSVYLYLKRLTDEKKAIVISGNHNKFFIDYLDGTNLSPFNYMRNGVRDTFADFLDRTAPFESWCFLEAGIEYPTNENFATWLKGARDEINKEYPDLLPWLKSLPHYVETKNYIGVHGAIDTMVEDWHYPHCERYNLVDWDALDFDDGSFFGSSIQNTDKTIIIGHFSTWHLRNIYGLADINDEEDYSILKRDDGKVIAIDGTINYTKKLNVFKVEDEIENETGN